MVTTARRRPGIIAALALLVALIAAACGGGTGTTDPTSDPSTPDSTGSPTDVASTPDGGYDMEALVQAAQEEGKVTIYSSQGLDALNEMAAAFEAEYPGIDVEVVRGIDGDLAAKIEAEFETDRGIADLYVTASAGVVRDYAQADRFLPPEGSQLLGEGAYDADQYVHDGNYFEVNAAVLVFGWNTELYPDGLTDYTDLLDPALADGKIGVVEPSVQSIVDFYVWLEEEYGEEYIEALAAQNPRIYPSALPMGEAVVSGEIFAGNFIAPIAAEPQKAQGAPIEYALGSKGAWGARYFGAVPTTAPNPNAGFLLANFMVTAEGQELITPFAGSVLPDIPNTLITNDQVREQDLDLLTEEFVASYQAKWNELFR